MEAVRLETDENWTMVWTHSHRGTQALPGPGSTTREHRKKILDFSFLLLSHSSHASRWLNLTSCTQVIPSKEVTHLGTEQDRGGGAGANGRTQRSSGAGF